MEILERIWEVVSGLASGVMRGFERIVTSVFGSANARTLKKFYPNVEAINAQEQKFQSLTDDELRGVTVQFRQRLAAGETLDDLLVEAFAVCREAGRRFLEMRHYDVQLIGGMILHSGRIAEMVTGEGKTLVATLAAYLNALSGQGVHVVTVNDYLARRDMEWMSRIYQNLGLTVGAIQSGMSADERQRAYACDITYGTNNEFGFDYLRDNMRLAARADDRFPKHMQQAQGRLNFAIVDEVDNILIDEARTPLIISGPAEDDITKYLRADKIARQLKKDLHFEVKEKEHSAHLTEDGVREAEKLAGVESFYTAGNMQWPHLIDNALKAHHLYKLDVNYVVQDGTIVIVDEFTGRLMQGRQWSDGLHQAVEAREGVPIKEENQTLATITLQNYFKLYNKISGMTGTAMTEAGEFWKIYKLDVVAVPTNRPLQRLNHPDVIYRTEREKFVAIADEIERMNKWDTVLTDKGDVVMGRLQDEDESQLVIQDHSSKKPVTFPQASVREVERKGRPILVGTVSIEKSERLANLLDKRGIRHEILNAKQHKREAEIVAQAGRRGAVTIATNMAGRGTDIVLGGNPETMAWALLQDKYPTRLEVPNEEWETLIAEIEQREQMKAEGETIKQIGGLHIIGTERHEARRIDLQLRGRCGRQGDPGSSRFYLSLEDDLMRIFAGDWVKGMLTRLGMQEGEAIESRMVSRRIEGAQRKVEERNFEIRKNLLEYDEVMDEQRKRVYSYRQRILDGANCRDLIVEMIESQIEKHMGTYLARDYGGETFAVEAGRLLQVELDPRDYFNVDYATAEQAAHEDGRRNAEQQVYDLIDENLPEDEEESEWNWAALARTLNTRWGLNVRDRDLKKTGRDRLAEHLLPQATEAIGKIDLQPCARCLDRDFGVQTACAWFHFKFGIELDAEAMKEQETPQILALARERAAAAYDEREAEYPVIVGLVHFARRDVSGARYDRDALVEWAGERFGQLLNPDDLRNKQRDEVRAMLVEQSRLNNERAHQAHQRAAEQIDTLYGQSQWLEGAINGQLDAFADWLNGELEWDVSRDELAKLERDEVVRRLSQTIEDRYRPEIRRMERALVLQILDTAWKDHLQMMDHLKSSISLRGYAQVDPKVEYKREGMRQFDGMWESIGEYVTNLIFKMEDLNEEFVGATWAGSEAVKEEAPSGIAAEQEAALQGSEGQSQKRMEPIRNREQRVGRNQLCPCGSGKKYKNCCLRKRTA